MVYKRIRDLREDRDLTQKQMAQALNCSQQVYSNYELGQRDIPTDILIKLSACQNSLRSVDNDYKITTVNVGCEFGFVFSS